MAFQNRPVRKRELPGTFIVIEGPDGSGTTTQAERLAQELGAEYRFEPTEMPIGEEVDRLISEDGHLGETVALAFASDRMVHVEEVLEPLLGDGKTVVCDRYYHSSLVYQPAMGLGFDWVKSLNNAAITPDLTIILDVSGETAMERVDSRGRDGNVFEELDFQHEVAARYLELPERLDEEIVVVDAEQPLEEVFEDILDVLRERGLL